jgi:hypothetical protein
VEGWTALINVHKSYFGMPQVAPVFCDSRVPTVFSVLRFLRLGAFIVQLQLCCCCCSMVHTLTDGVAWPDCTTAAAFINNTTVLSPAAAAAAGTI